MREFGICERLNCELSSFDPSVNGLFEAIAVVEGREERGEDATIFIPFIERFAQFFQCEENCSSCSGFLYRVTQPTVGLRHSDDGYVRRSRLNKMLETGYKLQARRVLP
jgi:hypothetical protein